MKKAVISIVLLIIIFLAFLIFFNIRNKEIKDDIKNGSIETTGGGIGGNTYQEITSSNKEDEFVNSGLNDNKEISSDADISNDSVIDVSEDEANNNPTEIRNTEYSMSFSDNTSSVSSPIFSVPQTINNNSTTTSGNETGNIQNNTNFLTGGGITTNTVIDGVIYNFYNNETGSTGFTNNYVNTTTGEDNTDTTITDSENDDSDEDDNSGVGDDINDIYDDMYIEYAFGDDVPTEDENEDALRDIYVSYQESDSDNGGNNNNNNDDDDDDSKPTIPSSMAMDTIVEEIKKNPLYEYSIVAQAHVYMYEKRKELLGIGSGSSGGGGGMFGGAFGGGGSSGGGGSAGASGGSTGSGLYFGGRILSTITCTCTSNTLVYVQDTVTNSSLPLIYQPGVTRLYSNYNVFTTGVQLLGSYTPGAGQCQIYVGTSCTSVNSRGMMNSIPGVGTSQTPGS